MQRYTLDSSGPPAVGQRCLVARHLYERAARLLMTADERPATTDAILHQPPAVLRATAARLQALAAWLETPASVPVPVPVPVSRPHRRRST